LTSSWKRPSTRPFITPFIRDNSSRPEHSGIKIKTNKQEIEGAHQIRYKFEKPKSVWMTGSSCQKFVNGSAFVYLSISSYISDQKQNQRRRSSKLTVGYRGLIGLFHHQGQV
jgi:hypothetical protein